MIDTTGSEIQILQDLLALEQLEDTVFLGQNIKIGSPRVFGGQVLGQALSAVTQTVPNDRFAHSLHGYFILSGDLAKPIRYEVELVRNGRSFHTRTVKAMQGERCIFTMTASFQVKTEGVSHQFGMVNVPRPEVLADDVAILEERLRKNPDNPAWIARKQLKRLIEFKPVEVLDPFQPQKRPPHKYVWFKANGILPDNPVLHRNILAYASDYNLLSTALQPHGLPFYTTFQIASLDHALWFHRDFRMDDWLLYAIDSPSSAEGRGFCRGSIFNRSGQLVASASQEVLMRKRRKK